ncbi:MAG: (d)CMP kinase [Bacilli bacterium]|jgi:CMP/dCMP kinase
MKYYSIAIDGPSASGKSTIAKILATKLGFTYIDTGAMYRAYTLAVINHGFDPKDEKICDTLIGKIKIDFDANNHITLDGEDVSARVRENDVSDNVSYVSTYKNIRLWLVEIQRGFSNNRSVIMDGRDIGTYVLPDATVKIFQVADINERAERRYMENLEKGIQSTEEECLANLQKRDYIDSNRAFAPLKPASDSILVDTTNLKISDVVDKIIVILQEKGIC